MKILNDFIAGVNQALFPNQATPQQLNQTRQLLSEQTQNCHQPFGRAVYNINGVWELMAQIFWPACYRYYVKV